MRAVSLCIIACIAAVVVNVSGGEQIVTVNRDDLAERVRKAERVVVATVDRVEAIFDINEFGDQLIFSIASVRLAETLKGQSERTLTVWVEGGTVGDLTLDVSDMPTIEAGERAVFLLDSTPAGTYVPHDRGRGILKLDPGDRVRGTDITLEDVRAAVRAVAQ